MNNHAVVDTKAAPVSACAFDSVSAEHSLVIEDIQGKLPAELRGTLYRNGPAQWQPDAGHVFDGNGMISQFVFDAGQLRYRNRFVRTGKYRAERNGEQVRGVGNLRPGGLLGNVLRRPADRANTHALIYGERLMALTDDGRPWQIDPDTLQTHGRLSFGGRLAQTSLFSAHPRVDPVSGDLFNFGIAMNLKRVPGLPVSMNIYRLSPNGRFDVAASFPLDRIYINHDFVITPRYFVFVLAPIVVAPALALQAGLGLIPFESATVFRESLGTRFVLVPRNGGKPRIIEHDTVTFVHFNNAYEDGNDVVIDLCLHSSWDESSSLLKDFRSIGLGNSVGGPLARFRVRPDNKISHEILLTNKVEFPQHDWRRTSLPYRYSYSVGERGNQAGAALFKVDNVTGQSAWHPFAMNMPGEPLFVPRHSNAAEDDGWLLCLTYLAEEHRSALFVLDASRIEAEPLAVAKLPHHQFPGFHGSFTRRVAP